MAELLLRLEESQLDADRDAARRFLDQHPSLAALTDRASVIDELVRRLEALHAVDAILFPGRDARGPRWPEIAGYEILGELDRGGMSVVYRARQLALERNVAVKVLLAGQFASNRLRDRFRREASTVARLRHPNIVPIYDSGESHGVPYLTLELVVGGNLKAKITGRPMPPPAAARLVETLARAVDDAHRQGVVHRDLKPSNVLLTGEGIPKIADFGLAKLLETDAKLTRTGETPGTPHYMAPEQIRGEPVGPSTDVYALGAILHEALTGRPPFAGESTAEVLHRVLSEEPLPVRRHEPGIPGDLEVICLKCLEKDAAARYQTAAALADDLQRFLLGEPIRARRHGPGARLAKWAWRRPATAALVFVTALAVAALWAGTIWHSRTLATALRESETNRAHAEANERSAVQREKSLQHYRYALHMLRADQDSRTANAAKVLSELAPYGDGHPESHLRGFPWYYLSKQCHLNLVTLNAHTDQVNMVAYSPDDKLLATASDDGTVRLWDGDTHRLITTLRGHARCVNELAFAPNGQWLVTASCDQTVKFWDLRSFGELATLDGFDEPVDWLALSPDGHTLVTPSRNSGLAKGQVTLEFWDVDSRTKKLDGAAPGTETLSADFSPDGAMLATAHTDGSIQLWDVHTGQPLHVLHGHGLTCFRARFSPDGSLLASASADGNTIVWDCTTFKQKAICRGRMRDMVYDVAFSPDSRRLAVARARGNVEIWDAVTGRRQSLLLGHNAGVRAICFRHDGRRVASGGRSESPVVKVWDATKGPDVHSMVRLPRSIRNVCFDASLKTCVVSDWYAGVSQRNVETGRVMRRFRKGSNAPGWSAQNTLIYSQQADCVVAGSPDGGLDVWRASADTDFPKRVASLAVADGRVVTWVGHWQRHGDANLVGVLVDEKEPARVTIAIWDTTTWTLRRRFDIRHYTQDSHLQGLAVHPLQDILAADLVGQIQLYSLTSGKLLDTTEASGWKTSLAFSDDGELLLWGSYEGRAVLWDRQTREPRQYFDGLEGAVHGLALSPDGKNLAIGDEGGNVSVWDVFSGQRVLHLGVMPATVGKLQWSADGVRLAAFCRGDGASSYPEIRVWSSEP